MRLIDADELKNLPFERMIHTDFGDTAIPIEEIDNAQTVEITKEQAIDVLHHYGWLVVRSEHKAVERPQGKWINESQDSLLCTCCNKRVYKPFIGGFPTERSQYYYPNFCAFCGADMRKGGAV